jgi:hypothetical protein
MISAFEGGGNTLEPVRAVPYMQANRNTCIHMYNVQIGVARNIGESVICYWEEGNWENGLISHLAETLSSVDLDLWEEQRLS